MNTSMSKVLKSKESSGIDSSSFEMEMKLVKNKGINILLVDDDPINLRLVQLILRPMNYNLVKAESGEEALIKIAQHEFSLILLDVNLPGISGYETARKIKSIKNSQPIPIIFITAHNQDLNQMIEGYSSGAVDYIFKPISHELLILKVNAFIKLKTENQSFVEEKLHLFNGEMINILESITDGFFAIDEKWRITYLNQTAENQFGKSRYELNGKQLKEECPFLTSEAFEMFEKAIIRQVPVTFDFHSPNTSLWWEIRVYPSKTGLAIYLNDISNRKQMELDLLSSNEQFYKVFQMSPNPKAIRSISDNRYIVVNDSWLQNLGYSLEELNLMKDQIIITIEENEKQTNDGNKEPFLRDQKITYTTKKEEIKVGLLSTEFMEFKGEPCILNVITDLTEWEQLQNKIKRLDRLNLVGEMAAGLGHEIRNPMQTVRGFIQLLSANEEFKSHNQYFSLMISEIDRVNEIISEYLNLAKTKRISLERQNLNDVIHALFPLMQAEANLSGKHIDLDLGDQFPILLDEKEIRQLLLNLVQNGLEASPNNGVLSIKTQKQDNHVLLTVTDQGAGIPEGVLKKMGTPFFTTKDNGTGLGLAICYSIAQRHNATIDIESGASGTTFLVKFKLK